MIRPITDVLRHLEAGCLIDDATDKLSELVKADEQTSRKFRLFEKFTIVLPVFQAGEVAYPIEARLKFRQNSDALTFWYELVRPDRVFKQAVDDAIIAIKSETGFMFLYGTPGTAKS